jgi:hypothetical protein
MTLPSMGVVTGDAAEAERAEPVGDKTVGPGPTSANDDEGFADFDSAFS